MKRIFIADDHAVVRLGLRQVLTDLAGFVVVAEASNGREVLQSDALGECDALILDLSLPVVGGAEVLRRVRALWPNLVIVVHSMHPADQFAARALADGADDYVEKTRSPTELIAAVRHAWTRRRLGHEPATVVVAASVESGMPHETLTQREYQVFQLVLDGRSVADIAAELDVHSCTVSNHLSKVRSKLGVSNVAGIVRYAAAVGLMASSPFDTEA